MRFTCEKYLLSLAVSTAGRAAASKSPVSALEGLLLEAGETGVRITGFDLKKGIYTSFAADVAEPGSVVISARLFGEIVRKLPDGIVSVDSDTYNTVHITCGNADYKVAGTPSEDYPELPAMDHGSSIVLSQETLSGMISQTGFAISTNESRPVYTGALLEVEGGVLTMVAVDGYRLALRREQVDSCDVEAVRFIVPGSALSDVEKICMNGEEKVTVTVGSKHVCFSVGDTVLISRRLEGDFLNYRKTVPFEFPVQLKANKSDLMRCAERVSLIIDDRTKNPLRCTFGDGRLTVECSTPVGRAEDSCEMEGNGGDMVIGFNNSYLTDALKAAPEENLIVNLISSSSPCVLTPEDGSEKFLYMILPEWGLMADVQPPDLETRMAITRNKAAQLGMILPNDVVEYIGENITSNIRQLEGVVKKLTAYRDLLNDEITVASAKRAIKDVIRVGSYVPTADIIISETARYYGLTDEAIRGQSRQKNTATARQVAMYLCRTLTNMALTDIGRCFEDRNHATVLSSIRKIEDLMKISPDMAATVRDINSNISARG